MSSQTVEVVIPDLGGAEQVDVVEVLVSVGDQVEIEQSLIGLESDKATMEVPSTAAGVVEVIHVAPGQKAGVGDVIVTLKSDRAALSEKEADSSAAPAPASTQPVGRPAPVKRPQSNDAIYAGPGVRRIAHELDVDLSQVRGTGEKGRITKDDLKKHLSAGGGMAVAAAPKVDFAQYGEIETKPLSKIKRLTGQFLHRNWVTVPHVTQFDEADITDMEAHRQANKAAAAEAGYKLTPIVFVMKAVVAVLKALPQFNASLDQEAGAIVMKKYYHIGVAVDTPGGLVVPVIRDVDQKSVEQLARELGAISLKAREVGLTPQEMQGGCITISSLGGIGGTAFTPIVNAPEAAILGLSKSVMRPVYQADGSFAPRLMLPVSLSYDHRLIDGADGARFTALLSEKLADVDTLVA